MVKAQTIRQMFSSVVHGFLDIQKCYFLTLAI